MFNNTSDYALNKKDKNSIVYQGCDGYTQHITKADFASEEEFIFWKSWSDENYHDIDNADTYYARNIVSIDTLDGCISNARSPEDTMIAELERQEQITTAKIIVKSFQDILTEVQFRRIWCHYALKLKVRTIAKQEGVAHPNIVKSIISAKKIILKKAGSEGTKMP